MIYRNEALRSVLQQMGETMPAALALLHHEGRITGLEFISGHDAQACTQVLELCAPVSDVYRDYTPERYYRRAAEAARKIAARVEEASGKKSR